MSEKLPWSAPDSRSHAAWDSVLPFSNPDSGIRPLRQRENQRPAHVGFRLRQLLVVNLDIIVRTRSEVQDEDRLCIGAKLSAFLISRTEQDRLADMYRL